MCPKLKRSVLMLILFGCLALPSSVHAASGSARPDLYVLSIGVSAYRDPSITPLRFADDDASAVVTWAQGQQERIYGQVHTRLMLNEEATRANIIGTLVSFFKAASPDDQLLLFLAGHGLVEKDTRRYHFLPSDSVASNIAGTALEQSDILEKLALEERIRKRVLVLVDSCHAGALAPQPGQGITRGGAYEGGDFQTLSDLDVRDKGSVWAIFTAGTTSDKAEEGSQYRLEGEASGVEGHGLFTHALLRALGSTAADGDHNGTVTLTEFQRFVTSTVKDKSSGRQYPVMSGKLMDVAMAWAVGTRETCDGVDNNLDGQVDEGYPDLNRNAVADCLDKEICNGVDDNGNGEIDEGYDLDRDGHRSRALCGSQFGDDCDDNNISIHPNQKDWGNLRDDDCDGLTDEDDFDLNSDGIPDLMENQARKMTRWSLLASGAGALLLAGGTYFLADLAQMRSTPSGDPPYLVDEGLIEDYNRKRIGATTLLGIAAPIVGVSIKLSFDQLDFRRRHFPKKRRLGGEQAGGQK